MLFSSGFYLHQVSASSDLLGDRNISVLLWQMTAGALFVMNVNIQYTTNGAYVVTNQTLCYKRGGGQVFNKCFIWNMRVHVSCDWKNQGLSMT